MVGQLDHRIETRIRETASRAIDVGFGRLAPERRFVIVSIGRSGSELLVSLLDSHPAIRCESEILFIRRALPTAFLLSRSLAARLTGAHAYGFKLLTHQAGLQDHHDPAGYLRRLHQRGFRFIVLERHDWLQQAISSMRASATQHHFREADPAVFSTMRVDPMAVLAGLYLIEDAIKFVRSALADIPQLTLVYEDDLAEPEAQQRTVDRICAYLGLATAPVQTDLVKHAPASTSAQVENFEELAAALSGTRYAEYLELDQGLRAD